MFFFSQSGHFWTDHQGLAVHNVNDLSKNGQHGSRNSGVTERFPENDLKEAECNGLSSEERNTQQRRVSTVNKRHLEALCWGRGRGENVVGMSATR